MERHFQWTNRNGVNGTNQSINVKLCFCATQQSISSDISHHHAFTLAVEINVVIKYFSTTLF